MKRIFKGPWLWVVLAAIGVLLAIQFLAPSDGYDEINTSRMNEYIAQGEVDEVTFVDGDHTGEPLRVVRRADGTVSHLDLASFRFTRTPYDRDADIPGGVDEPGWS